MASFLDKVTMFDRRSSTMDADEDMPHGALRVAHHQHSRPRPVAASPESYRTSATLGHLFQRVNDAHVAAKGDDDSSSSVSADGSASPHYVLELDSMSPQLVSGSASMGGGIELSRLPPFVLKFTDLTYCVKVPKKISLFSKNHLGAESTNGPFPVPAAPLTGTKTLLDSISGEAREGEILAVLGASGSGKSTFIDALADRIERRSLQGSVTLNGELLESRMLKVISAYVMQDDLLYPMLTVEETLMFSAEFRLPRTLSASKKKARVQELIDQLGLRPAAKTIIGDEGHRGISGGERRRVSIGVDIIHNPILLFLDEPTSGLDSTSAFMVIKVLQNIAHSGSVVIMSVHQPSHRILGLLDQILFLSRGRSVYNGSPRDLAGFFESFGRPIPANGNPTESVLDLIRELEVTPEGTKRLADFNRSRRISISRAPGDEISEKPSLSLKDAISASISRGKLVSGTTDVGAASGSNPSSSAIIKYANPFWVETVVLAKRSFLNSKRTPELFATRLITVLVTGFLLATIFWRLDNTPKGVTERLGFFAIAMSTMFFTCTDALPVFIQERYIFLRETAYNAYRRSSYVIANTIVGFPPLVLLSVAFAVTTFFAVGLAGGTEGFIFFVLIVLASFWAGSGFAIFISGVVNNIMLGFTVVIALLAYFLLFSGFFINRDRIHSYWLWFHYMSLVKYPYEAVMQNEFNDPSKCFVRGVQMFYGSPLDALPTEMKLNVLKAMSNTLGVNIGGNTCITTGVDILKREDITQLSKWNCFWVTMAWGLLFRFLFYISLLLGSRNKRK